ncbi:hypothetical protein FACS1894199_14280 [Bacteroidia bacterium]|nr:hypothetical protein FACS1894199_14280 [Bacteroidia bacterium]
MNEILVIANNRNTKTQHKTYQDMKKYILILSYYFTTIVTITAQSYSGGSGTEASPYLISSKADMEALADGIWSGTTYSGEHFLLTKDLVGADSITESIGRYNVLDNSGHPFCGSFDGGGHIIKLNSENGVFGYVQNGTIKNVGVEGIVATNSNSIEHIGAICGYASSSTISHCYNSATCSATFTRSFSPTYLTCIGGICGRLSSSSITNCYNLGNITASGNYNCYAGGICGYYGTISDCYNLGNIASTVINSAYEESYAGGICGYGATINSCCAANSSITAKRSGSNNSTYVKRIVGSGGTVSGSYALSTMTINGSTVSGTSTSNANGSGVALSSFQSQSWIETNLGWDFNTIWKISIRSSVNHGLPIFKAQSQPQSNTITASNGDGGNISEGGDVVVYTGSNQSFHFEAKIGYTIDSLFVDDIYTPDAITAGSYTFTNVIADHSIRVSFKKFSGGIGTEDLPYLISSKADMEALATFVNSGTTYSGTYFLLTRDLIGADSLTSSVGIRLNTPYGTNFAFSGTFDGGEHEIEMKSANGVFGYLSGATVKNLGVQGTISALTLASPSSTTYAYVGGIYGYASSSTISNCHNSATITSTLSSYSGLGGYSIVGGIGGYSSASLITNCYNSGSVSSSSEHLSTVGGICGDGNYEDVTISNCYNYGEILSSGYSSMAGGICGESISISNCYNMGNISSTTSSLPSAGSICGGGTNANINSCFAVNSIVTAKNNYGNNSSAIGRISGNQSAITDCYAIKTMTINGATKNSSSTTEKDGCGTELSSFQSQSWIETNLGWDFNTVWGMSGINSPTQGLPIFKSQIQTFTIAASSGSGGNISTSGSISVVLGNNQTFTFTPATGYEINQVLVDGVNNTAAVSAKSYTFTNVTSNHIISVSFKKKISTITVSAGANGSISPSTNQTVTLDSVKTFTIIPHTGYDIDQVLIDGVNNTVAVSSGTYTFTNVTANNTISVSFKQKQYTITVSAGSNGNISPSTTQTVGYSSSKTFTFTPATGYEINQVLVNGVNNTTAVSSGTYTFTNVTADSTISVSFKQKQYTITPTAGSNGNISPSSEQTVTYGGSKTFTFTPATGYQIDQVFVNGVNNTAAVSSGTYTFTHVTANRTISVSFKQKQYTIAVFAGSNGSISPSTTPTVTHGNSQTFTFTPNDGYEINQVLVNEANNTAAVSSGTYTFTNVTADSTISVSFKQKQYTITPTAGSNGNISPSSEQTVTHGGSKTFTFTPSSGYKIKQVLVDGVNDSTAVSTGTYSFSNVTTNHSISVSFKKVYTITASMTGNGSIFPNDNIIVEKDSSQSFVFSPNDGYEIYQLLVDRINNDTAIVTGTYTFSSVTANHTIAVSFKPIPQYIVKASAGNNGSISPNGDTSIYRNSNLTYTFIPNDGYEIENVFVDGVNNAAAISNGIYTFSNVTEDHTISVSFKKAIRYTITASAKSNGSISPNGDIIIVKGESQTFTFTPDNGYEVNHVFVDGVNKPTAASTGTYTFFNVADNHSLEVTFRLSACLPNVIVQVWDDVLSVRNDSARNGGYTFQTFQWKKDGVDMAGETSGYLYIPNVTKDDEAEYIVLLTTANSSQLYQSCPAQLQLQLQTKGIALKSFPNPTKGLITVEHETIQTGETIKLYDMNGNIVQQWGTNKNQTTIDLSAFPKGLYILGVNNSHVKILRD